MNKILGLINLLVGTAGLYAIGRLIYMHTLYYTDFGIFIITMIMLMFIILSGVILNTIGYLTNFKESDYKNGYALVIGIVMFVGLAYNWTTEIKESEYDKIKSLYKETKNNHEVEKLFKAKFKKSKEDNIITRAEYFELKRINQYYFYLKNKSIKKTRKNFTLE